MTENKQFKIRRNALGMKFISYDDKNILLGTFADIDGLVEIVDLLNEQEERIKKLKETIIKITLSYHQKHDNTIVNLVDGVYEEDIGDLFIEWNHGDSDD